MNTKSQYYLIESCKENIEVAKKEIAMLYKDFHELKNKIPNEPIGYISEDGIKVLNPDYKIDILTGIIHQIGYWEGNRALSYDVLNLINMSDDIFKKFLEEEHIVKKKNDETIKELLDKIKGVR